MGTTHEDRERESHARLPHVVIIGGGFGGLYAARGLARAPVNVTVVDKHNYHLFRPMLYQVATGLLYAVVSFIRPGGLLGGIFVLMASGRIRIAVGGRALGR